MNRNELYTALDNLLDMEYNIYMIQNLISDLEAKKSGLGHAKEFYKPVLSTAKNNDFGSDKLKDTIKNFAFAFAILGYIGFGIFAYIDIKSWEDNGFDFFFEWIIIEAMWGTITAVVAASVGAIIGFFVGGSKETKEINKTQKQNEERYNSELDRYNKNVKEDNIRVDRERRMIRKYNSDISVLEDKLSESRKVLNDLYNGYGIVSNYRNAVAIGYMRELLEIGAAVQLEGPNQLYEKARASMREDRVVECLNNISFKLDTVIGNQNRLFGQLQTIKAEQAQLTASIEREAQAIKYSNQVLSDNIRRLGENSRNSNSNNNAVLEYEAKRIRKELEYQNYRKRHGL